MKKIKNAKITFILKKLIAYAPAAHKLFTKKLFEEQIIKLSVRNLKVNIKKKKIFLIFVCEFSCLSNFEKSNSNQNAAEFENRNQFYEREASDDFEIDHACFFDQNFDQFSD